MWTRCFWEVTPSEPPNPHTPCRDLMGTLPSLQVRRQVSILSPSPYSLSVGLDSDSLGRKLTANWKIPSSPALLPPPSPHPAPQLKFHPCSLRPSIPVHSVSDKLTYIGDCIHFVLCSESCVTPAAFQCPIGSRCFVYVIRTFAERAVHLGLTKVGLEQLSVLPGTL